MKRARLKPPVDDAGPPGSAAGEASVRRQERVPDYDPVAGGFPVREEAVIQTGPGRFAVDAKVARVADVGLLRVRVGVASVGVTVLDPAYVAFALPLSWTGEYVINGEVADPSCIYLPGSMGSAHVRGGERDTLGVVLPRDRFVETVAALRGVYPEDVKLGERVLRLSPAASAGLRRRLVAIVDEACAKHVWRPPEDIANETFGLLADAYLHGGPDAMSVPNSGVSSARIVLRAEEAFMAAAGRPVSMANLCAAAGVSKSALYVAFHRVYGVAPLGYFRKRRLMQARSRLLRSRSERGAVKRAALSVGLRELGRFSVEYRRLFGESPSATLAKDAG